MGTLDGDNEKQKEDNILTTSELGIKELFEEYSKEKNGTDLSNDDAVAPPPGDDDIESSKYNVIAPDKNVFILNLVNSSMEGVTEPSSEHLGDWTEIFTTEPSAEIPEISEGNVDPEVETSEDGFEDDGSREEIDCETVPDLSLLRNGIGTTGKRSSKINLPNHG